MRYRVTCLTPTLVGDGSKLSPIDYMVWKEHVNVLDQRRILRLLANGPRFEGYLAQLKRAEKLDFASWGGFAQNYAGRRIPFEHASAVPVIEKMPAAGLFIPTFATSATGGAYLPATAIKGALRTAAVFDRWSDTTMRDLVKRIEADEAEGKRIPRNPALKAEEAVLGGAGKSLMRRVSAGDSGSIAHNGMKVYMLRTSTLVAKGEAKYELGWKSSRGTAEAKRIDDSTPTFAEMASPGTSFEGVWSESSERDRAKMFHAANGFASAQLAQHKLYAEWTGLAPLAATVSALEARLGELGNDACVLNIGWGGGVLSKNSVSDTSAPDFRTLAKRVAFFEKALRTGLPFPKTRRIIFQDGKAAQLAGFVLLQVI